MVLFVLAALSLFVAFCFFSLYPPYNSPSPFFWFCVFYFFFFHSLPPLALSRPLLSRSLRLPPSAPSSPCTSPSPMSFPPFAPSSPSYSFVYISPSSSSLFICPLFLSDRFAIPLTPPPPPSYVRNKPSNTNLLRNNDADHSSLKREWRSIRSAKRNQINIVSIKLLPKQFAID